MGLDLLGVLVAHPWLALVPAAAFFALGQRTRRRLPRVAALCWVVYYAYELAMQRRILCSGECNIRVDLLLIYPTLALLTLSAIIASLTHD